MKRLLVRSATERDLVLLKQWLTTTRDGQLFDHDVLAHDSTFVLSAFNASGVAAHLPIQQPLMLENLVFRPGLKESETAQAMVRLVEHAVEEAYRRDAGELYFLCRDQSTCGFAEHYGFKNLADVDPSLKFYRMNLLETFGC